MPSDPVRQGDLNDFDPVWYLQTYEDVRAAGMDPLDHYLTLGRAEGRQGAPVQALELDHMLWRGYEAMALPALEALLADGSPRERAVAGWALARWRKEQGDMMGAREAILAFHDGNAGMQTLRHPGPFLLGIQICLTCGDPAGAERILLAGVNRFGPLPDFELGGLLQARFHKADDWELDAYLHRLHGPHGLVPVWLDQMATGPRFDRLRADAGPRLDDRLPEAPPLVSVIVPVFNGARGLATALRGLSAQSWPNLEILVVDDGSSDDSLAIARAAAEEDPRIHVLAHAQNQGAYPARNTGFAAAQGAFITVHDADDWSHPQKIELQIRPLLAEPDLQATVSHWVRVSDDLDMTRWRMEDRWVYRNVSSLMVRAEMRDSLGYWDRVRVNADTEYYYRVIAAFGPQSIREVCPGVPLAFGRTEAQSLTNQSATHLRTQFKGLRRDYMEAAHVWHARRCADQSGLFMPQHPEVRPFRVPAAIGLGDPEGPPSDFDILSASDLFDQDWYRLCHLDVLMADVSPVRHYLSGGARENRDPGPLFSSGGYRRVAGLDEATVPLLHYELEGREAGLPPLPSFPGALADVDEDQPRTLVFAHTSGKTLFGAERSLLGVLERMARRGRNPVVVVPTLRNMAYLNQLLQVSVAVEVLPQIWRHALRRPPLATVQAIQGLISKHRAQDIHVNTLVLDAPLAAARAEGVRSLVHVRELPDQDVALRRNLGSDAASLRRALLDEADGFVATSQPVADWLACPGRVAIRPNSVDEALFEMRFAPKQTLNIALISSNIAKKGIADFLAIARLVAQEKRPVRFRLIGPGTPDLHLMRPLPANVEFRGYAQTPAEALAQADVVMSISKFAESFGRTVMEAMAAGRPVICYDRGAPPSLVENGVSGFVVPADNPRCAANAVLALEAARGQLAVMSDAARIRARYLQEMALQA
ncbi:glycosyltransferase [Pseudoprimorskyibacter insulae]|uniref:Glycosyltransferase EpsH n=1 Tax=Pseudoprimorskyibacter insulae TaxID=1695997 RepID=A0A2R8B0I1_9RHOB|nr:glycosyltransferase [Pseudoprimorskyibacter insulae]SPF81796.1 Putative glycosyltransferase EpsH [Pseudoprimorskyibacter insulae]